MMNIYQSIAGIMSEGYAIAKEKRNQQQGFMYRGIDDVMNTFQPLMAKYKVFCVPEVISQSREERTTSRGGNLIYSILHMNYTFYAEDGSHITASVIGEGMDSADKSSNKAMAVAMKYAMFQTFCIPTEEMEDPDATTPPESAPKKPAQKKAAPKKAEPAPKQEEPAPAPAPTQDYTPPKFVCEHCGKEIPMYKDRNGKTISLRKWSEGTKKAYGHQLCAECVELYQNIKKENDNA